MLYSRALFIHSIYNIFWSANPRPPTLSIPTPPPPLATTNLFSMRCQRFYSSGVLVFFFFFFLCIFVFKISQNSLLNRVWTLEPFHPNSLLFYWVDYCDGRVFVRTVNSVCKQSVPAATAPFRLISADSLYSTYSPDFRMCLPWELDSLVDLRKVINFPFVQLLLIERTRMLTLPFYVSEL